MEISIRVRIGPIDRKEHSGSIFNVMILWILFVPSSFSSRLCVFALINEIDPVENLSIHDLRYACDIRVEERTRWLISIAT
jgi:hypothetical protein